MEIIRCGRWDYPRPGDKGFEITPADIREFHDNFNAGVMGPEVPLNVDHVKANECGWVKAVEIGKNGRSLYGFIDPTEPDVREKLDKGTLKFASAELDFERVCPERSANGDNKTYKVLEGLALTNHPYLKNMDAVERVVLSDAAALNSAGVHFPSVAEIAATEEDDEPTNDLPGAALAENNNGGNMPEITLADIQRENAELKAKLAELGNDTTAKAALAEAKATRTLLAMRDTEDAVKRLVRRGKVSPIVGQKVLRFAEILHRSDTATITLAEPVTGRKYRLADGEADPISKLDVIGEVIDMLGQLPDAVAMDPARADLAEADDDNDKGDDEAKLKAEADKIKASEPHLSLREAYKKARVNLADKSRGGGA